MKQKLRNLLRSTDGPVLVASDLAKCEGAPERFADPVINKPAPPPPQVTVLISASPLRPESVDHPVRPLHSVQNQTQIQEGFLVCTSTRREV